ncbi:MAG: YIP1 family protein [Nitrospirae bacterium]|nr:YIP1 family protein [Nitrospirota bacterium]
MNRYNIDLFAIPSNAVRVLTRPSDFFRHMPRAGGFIEPLVFMVSMGVLSGLLRAVINILEFRLLAGIGKAVATFLFVPITIGLFGFLLASALFILWMILGSQQSYQTSYRCVAYMSALTPVITVLSIVPFLGGIAGFALMIVFIVVVSVEVHDIPAQRAMLFFGILGLILVLGLGLRLRL